MSYMVLSVQIHKETLLPKSNVPEIGRTVGSTKPPEVRVLTKVLNLPAPLCKVCWSQTEHYCSLRSLWPEGESQFLHESFLVTVPPDLQGLAHSDQ